MRSLLADASEISVPAGSTVHTQPLEAPWNHQGMGNNAVHRLAVTVR